MMLPVLQILMNAHLGPTRVVRTASTQLGVSDAAAMLDTPSTMMDSLVMVRIIMPYSKKKCVCYKSVQEYITTVIITALALALVILS